VRLRQIGRCGKLNWFVIQIRNQQLFALGKALEQRFVQEMAEHIRAYFPERAEDLDQAAMERRIAEALTTARTHGLRSKQDCCRYLNVVGVCGWDFEREEKYAWAVRALNDPEVTSPSERLDGVLARCLRRLKTDLNNLEQRRQFGLDEVHSL
jgi:hypothetical protein